MRRRSRYSGAVVTLTLLAFPELTIGCGDTALGGGEAELAPADPAVETVAPPAAAAAAPLAALPFTLGLQPAYDATEGSGNFGSWGVDERGLPLYAYDNGSNADKQPFTNSERPYHLLGNGGSLTHSYADGYHVLMSTRTYPRYANYFRPSRTAFAGGFGWIHDRGSNETFSTYFPEARDVESYDTSWGMGYARKRVVRKNIVVVEDTYSPVGDDEVVMQRITIKNESNAPKTLSYYSYWDWDSYLLQATLAGGNTGYYENEQYGLSCESSRQALKARFKGAARDLTRPDALLDPSPKTAFFSMLNTDITGFEMETSRVFGAGQTTPVPNALNLQQLTQPTTALCNGREVIARNSQQTLFVAEKRVTLAPGQSTTLHTLYGFARSGQENTIIDRYRSQHANRFDELVNDVARKSVQFTPGDSADKWLTREVAWDAYHLYAGTLLEDFFGTHTLNQNSQYLLNAGQNIAPRDNVQHILPLIYSNPKIAKETLVYVLRNMFPNGKLPFGSSGYGAVAAISSLPPPLGWEPSDLGLWAAVGIAEYVNATRDYNFLNETHTFRKERPSDAAQSAPVWEMLKRAINYQIDVVGVGEHKLARILTSDWADGLTGESGNEIETHKRGESTHTTALAVWAYPMVRELAARRADTTFQSKVDGAYTMLRTALKAQWRTNKFNRAYMVDPQNRLVELGHDIFLAESNTFALLPEDKLLDAAQIDAMISGLGTANAITNLGLNISGQKPAGWSSSLLVKPGFTVWYSLNGAFVRGLANYADISPNAKQMAWAELKRNTLKTHATEYPNQFYGITSGSDSWNTTVNNPDTAANVPGGTWLAGVISPPTLPRPPELRDKAYPINNMHSHSHLVYNTLKLAGVHARPNGFLIKPAMPTDDGFGWESETFGLRYEQTRISGKIRALATETVTMTVTLNDELFQSENLVVRNGESIVAFTREGRTVTFQLPLVQQRDVLWSVRAS
jgi:hypothetical protein